MKIYELINGLFDKGEAKYLGETDQEVEFGALLKVNNRYYRCSVLNSEENSLYVRFVDYWIPKDEDTYNNDYLICPYCGYKDCDSFELSDEEDEYECPQCGSILKYHKEISVSYDVEVVKEKEPLEIEFRNQENENEQETQN